MQDALLKALQQWPYTGVPAQSRRLALSRRAQRRARRAPAPRRVRGARPRDRRASCSARLTPSRRADCGDRRRRAADGVHVLPSVAAAGRARRAEPEDGRRLQRRRDRPRVPHRRRRRSRSGWCAPSACSASSDIGLELPHGSDLGARIDSVLEVIYLLFNEGYSAHAGDDLIRQDLCGEALRLGRLVAQSPHVARGIHGARRRTRSSR